MHAVAATCPFVLFFVGFALHRRAVARVSCGRGVFRAGERVEPISRTGFLLPYTTVRQECQAGFEDQLHL